MRYSANLNIILKAIEKATARISRDFSELENLQMNPTSAVKFTNAAYAKIKEILIEDLSNVRPEYNIVFADGQKVINKETAEYNFVIYPIDGINNLVRAIPDFTIAIALEHINKDGTRESISVAINKIIGNELYYCEKGFGAFLNNRKIRTSKRGSDETPLICLDDYSYFDQDLKNSIGVKSFSLRSYGCRTLEIAYLASAKFDLAFFKNWNYEYLKPFLLLVREANGKVFEKEKFVLASNNLINLS